MTSARHTFLSLGLLLSVAAATQGACNDKDDAPLATDGLRGEWYLQQQTGGFRMGPPPSYTLKNTTERLSFSQSGTFVYERFDTLGNELTSSTHEYEVTARIRETFDDQVTKLAVRYTPAAGDKSLDTFWLVGNHLVTDRYAPAYDGIARHYARVSQ